jgi:hypothetical protein
LTVIPVCPVSFFVLRRISLPERRLWVIELATSLRSCQWCSWKNRSNRDIRYTSVKYHRASRLSRNFYLFLSALRWRRTAYSRKCPTCSSIKSFSLPRTSSASASFFVLKSTSVCLPKSNCTIKNSSVSPNPGKTV